MRLAFSTFLLALVVCLAALPMAGQVSAADAILIRAKHLYSMTGPPRENQEVLVRGNRIVAVGDVIRPLGTYQVIEVDTLMPGMIDASSSAGLRGGDAEQTREVTPDFETVVSLDWNSRDFSEAIAGGITTVNVMPGTENVIAGFSCLVKTAGSMVVTDQNNDRIVDPRTGLVMAVCSDPTGGNRSRTRPDSIYVRLPTNRMGVVWILRNRLQRARVELDKPAEEPDPVDVKMAGLLEGDFRAFGVSRTSYDIQTLLELAQQHGFQPVVFGGHEAYKTVDALVDAEAEVVFTAQTDSGLIGQERTDLFWNTPGKLTEAGVPVTLAGGQLLERARFAVRYGMDADAALQAITTRPAQLLGQSTRLGQIAADFDADLVAFDGPPLEFTTNLLWVMVDGNVHQSSNGE
jgi:imidazolonepropionase-like amidohydrolase